jgi:hypothetical protein
MVKMDEDRITKTQCNFCGSRLKKIAEIHSKANNEIIGYSLICCNCGHVDNFALDTSAIPIYTIGMRDNIKMFDLRCGIPIDSKIKCEMECNMERPCIGCKKPAPKKMEQQGEVIKAPIPSPMPDMPEFNNGVIPQPRIIKKVDNEPKLPDARFNTGIPPVEATVSATITAKPKNTMKSISFGGSETKYQ